MSSHAPTRRNFRRNHKRGKPDLAKAVTLNADSRLRRVTLGRISGVTTTAQNDKYLDPGETAETRAKRNKEGKREKVPLTPGNDSDRRGAAALN